MESATETKPQEALPFVRVKTCGKSARIITAMWWWGKPHLEQDKIGRRFNVSMQSWRVCRKDRWLLRHACAAQNPAYTRTYIHLRAAIVLWLFFYAPLIQGTSHTIVPVGTPPSPGVPVSNKSPY